MTHHYSMNLTLKDTNSDHTVTIDVNDGKMELSGDEVLYPAELQLVLCLTQALQHWLKGRYDKMQVFGTDALQHFPEFVVKTK